jgi:hypothetical protein
MVAVQFHGKVAHVTTRRSATTFAVVLLIIVAGVVLLYAVRAQVSPTIVSSPSPPTPNATAPIAGASPTVSVATPRPTAAARPGLITRAGDMPWVVRTETDATPIRTLPDSGWSISADGARMTYWTESAAGAELHITEFSGGDRVVATFAGRLPGGVVWSTDGTGLLVSLAEPDDPRFRIARILLAVDIASGTSREVYRGIGPSGASVVPLVWRRSPEIFAAYETGPGGYSFGYTVIRPGQAPVRSDPDSEVLGMAASSDNALVSGQWIFQTGVLKVWPVDDFSKKTELRLTAGEYIGQPQWWPGRTEIAFAAGRLEGGVWHDRRIERWDPLTGVRTVLLRLPDAAQLGAYLVRADGSGLLTMGPYPPGAWEVTDLGTGAKSAVPQAPGENIIRTVLIR